MEEFFNHIRKGESDKLDILLDRNPDWLNARDSRGSTPLILAAYYNQEAVVDLLLARGADVNEKDAAGNTALMGVCFKGYEEIAEKLIDAGADMDSHNSMGAGCLIFAVTFNRLGIVRLLLEKGADASQRDARGNTALDHARMQELHPIVEMLENIQN